MRSFRPSVEPAREDQARGRSIKEIAPRDLDYATWHAHIAGVVRLIAPPAVPAARSADSVAAVHSVEAISSERRAA